MLFRSIYKDEHGKKQVTISLEVKLQHGEPFNAIRFGRMRIILVPPTDWSRSRKNQITGDRYIWFSRSDESTYSYQYMKQDLGGMLYYQDYESSADFTMPEFKKGQSELWDFLKKNMIYPQEAYNEGKEGLVLALFQIHADGSVSDISIISSPDTTLSLEAIRLINQTSGMWIPGTMNQQPISTYKYIAVTFQLIKSGIRNITGKNTEILLFYLFIGILILLVILQQLYVYRKNKRIY